MDAEFLLLTRLQHAIVLLVTLNVDNKLNCKLHKLVQDRVVELAVHIHVVVRRVIILVDTQLVVVKPIHHA